jgi:ABC-2 type transport system permease protein
MKKPYSLKKIYLWSFLIVLALGVMLYAVAHEQFLHRVDETDALTPSGNVGEIISGDVVEQQFSTEDDTLSQISLYFQTYARANTGTITIYVLDGEQALFETALDISSLQDNTYVSLPVNLSNIANRMLTLRIRSETGVPGNAVTLAYGDSMSAGKVDVAVSGLQPVVKNGQAMNGSLCLSTVTISNLWFGQYYWYFFAAVMLLLGLYFLHLIQCEKAGRHSFGLSFLDAITRYRFLLRQLVNRDFKTRYKRSVLGVFWSFLNPLLTMFVQYIVFSTLFKSDIPNYAVYLLTGIVCFSYFSESVNQCMVSITGNASLITKVYVPKYIYPLSKALSSGINLLLSLIPLLLVALITGIRFRASLLLLPFGLVCLFVFCLGMGMLLATSMVFFRDTQFLWSVFSMLWMYCTPIFYPESIIPASLMPLFKMNPLYHIIRFCRTVLISGVSPEPKAYLFCISACVVPLLLGVWAFKKNQDKFILYV